MWAQNQSKSNLGKCKFVNTKPISQTHFIQLFLEIVQSSLLVIISLPCQNSGRSLSYQIFQTYPAMSIAGILCPSYLLLKLQTDVADVLEIPARSLVL